MKRDVPASTGSLLLGLTDEGLRWAVADLSGPAEVARIRLDLSPIAAVALGRVLSAAALLLRFTTKNPGSLGVEVAGDGPLGRVVAEVASDGGLRGMVGEAHIETPASGQLEIGWAVGEGLLKVTRERATGERYSSQVALVDGEIGSDLAHYLDQSEQIRSAAMLGVLPGPEGVMAAGGLLVEALPGTPDESIARVEANIAALDGVSARLAAGGAMALASAVLDGFHLEAAESHLLEYRCRCNGESLMARLRELPEQDLDSITDSAGAVVAECAFCGERYAFPRERLSPAN